MFFWIVFGIVLIQISLINSQQQACPSASWTLYNNDTCHMVVVTPANGFQAQQVCGSLGGNLAAPVDNNELTAIKNGVLQLAWNKWGAQDTWVFSLFY